MSHDAARDSERTFLKTNIRMRPLLEDVRNKVVTDILKNPVRFSRIFEDKPTGKNLIRGDVTAEDLFMGSIETKCPKWVQVNGEEDLSDQKLDFTDSNKLHVLCDMIDGTDLLLRGFSNWCSAVVAFDPSSNEIISSYVLIAGGNPSHLYSAAFDRAKVHKTNYREVLFTDDVDQSGIQEMNDYDVIFRSATTDLYSATICAYGQKIKNMMAISKVFSADANNEVISDMSDARYYNLAGNPMMCRILDGAVDVVFDVCGQEPHDVIPGAYIALKGGAKMFDLGEQPVRKDRTMEIKDLMQFLYKPNKNRMKYVLAANEAVGEHMMKLILDAGV